MPLDREIFEYDSEEDKSSFDISEHEDGSIHVTATANIPNGSFIMPSHMAASFVISERSISNLKT